MAMRGWLSGLGERLGSGFAVVEQGDGGFLLWSSSAGLGRLILAGGLLFLLAVVILEWRRGRLRQAREIVAVLGVCLVVILSFLWSDLRVTLPAGGDTIVIEERGVLGDLWVSRTVVPVSEVEEIGIDTGRIKAATRNGTPVGPDRTGYFLRLRSNGWQQHTLTFHTTHRDGLQPLFEAGAALVRVLEAHPATDGEMKTNFHRYRTE